MNGEPTNGGATIREVHTLLDTMRDEIISAVRQDQRSQMDFNLNIATRIEAMATRLSAHETMPSHPMFQTEMNRVVEGLRESSVQIREELKEHKKDIKAVSNQVTDLRISYARDGGIAFMVALIISIAIQVVPKLIG